MKKVLLITSMLMFTGCENTKQDKFEPNFLYNQEVTFKHGFFKGQKGTVVAATKCITDGQGTYSTDKICYTVVIGESPLTNTWFNVPERELVD